ncbi:MAG TPA: SpoIIE family protein phosphatase [Rubrobacteraceae bacterium]|nr:SpoIIE family protein phosphatase [Rubrobacteraceae bacterium]
MEPSSPGVYRENPLERRSSEQSRLLLDRAVAASSNGIVITDPNLPNDPIVYVNPAFERITGYAADEVMGRNCRFLQGEDRDQAQLEQLRTALGEGRGCRVVLRNYKKDGRLFWNELYISPVYSDEGRLTHFVGVQNDVTDRRRIEEALRRSEDRLRLAVEATGLGTWDFDPATGELKWDERCKAMFGLPPDAEVDYGVFLTGLHPDDREWTDSIVRRALSSESGGGYEIEYRTVGLGDGIERWVAARGQAFFDETGRPVRFVGTVLDITERKRAEEERDRLLARERQARSEAVAVRRRLELLASTGPVLYSSFDSGSTLEKIARLLVPELADWCLVDVVDEEGAPHQVAAVHADSAKKELLQRHLDHRRLDGDAAGTVGQVLKTGRSVLVPEISDALLAERAVSGEHLEVLRRLEVRSIISVPLLARGRTLGALTLISSRPERRYEEEDLTLAEALAYRCALAVENSRLYRERSYIARTLQRSLLPRLPEVPGVEVGIEYLPVGEENEVGGDFYDLIEAGGMGETGCWIAVIGDVCGKGAAAAATTALTRYTVRAVAMRESEPAKILSDLNEAMIRQEEDNQFCTVACARLEPLDDGNLELVVARGGHPPPLLLRADGAVEAIDPPGKVIGVFEDPGLEGRTACLRAGDAAVFYTDGVLEARGPDGSLFGEERLVGLVRSCAGLTAPAIAERLRDVALKFGEGSRRDDLAVLVLRVPETPSA